jgi:hypothetical protein
MAPDLLFEGLKTLKKENKDVCFLHPDNFHNQAQKRTDMPTKFQRIHKEWANFEEPLAKFKSKLKRGKSKFFKLSMWLGSMVEPKKLLGKFFLDWDDTRANGGRVKIVYKHTQVLRMAKNIIIAGILTDVDMACLTKVLWQTMEEARKKMVAKNPAKYGALLATPKFSMLSEFVKNTLY